jgi:hypothetical protein
VAASGSEDDGDDDPMREAKAYNDNIYLMVSAPYVLLAACGFLIYRGFKKAQGSGPAPPPGPGPQ